MSDPTIYSLKTRVADIYQEPPSDYIEHITKWKRREFGVMIYDVLRDSKTPLVVDIRERFDKRGEATDFVIEMKCWAVENQTVIIAFPKFISRKATFLEKVKWLFNL
jgi:hypothetical protein